MAVALLRARWRLPVVLLAGYATAQTLARTCTATRGKRSAAIPGDDIVPDPQTVVTRGITIPVTPEEVWPWLVQVGWHRGGWYTARWVDALFFRSNSPSADRLLPEHERLEVGDFIPDGPPDTECGFVVQDFSPASWLVLHSTTHLPLSWRRRDRARVSWTWSFVLTPLEDGRATRLVFRWRARTWPWWLTMGVHAIVVPADVVMSHDMLHGLRARAVRHHAWSA
jgi:hypothetical protein